MPTVIVGVANIPVNNELLIVSTEIPYHGFTIIQEGYVSDYMPRMSLVLCMPTVIVGVTSIPVYNELLIVFPEIL